MLKALAELQVKQRNAANDKQRMELIAKFASNAVKGGSVFEHSRLLASLMGDTAKLTEFIRHAGLSDELRAALQLEEHGTGVPLAILSPQSAGELIALIAKGQPAAMGVEASYDANGDIGEAAAKPAQGAAPDAGKNQYQNTAQYAAQNKTQFQPFQPTQFDFDNTIDNLKTNAEEGEAHGFGFAAQPSMPLDSDRQASRQVMVSLYIFAVAALAALLFGCTMLFT